MRMTGMIMILDYHWMKERWKELEKSARITPADGAVSVYLPALNHS